MSEKQSIDRRGFLKALGVGAAVTLLPIACSYEEAEVDAAGGGAYGSVVDDPFGEMPVLTRTDPGAWGGKEDGHIPQAVFTKLDEEGNFRVDVTVQHAMKPEHWIKHIWLRNDGKQILAEKELLPTAPSPASATFTANVNTVERFKVYELCNLHGLWMAEYEVPSV
jgi:desulfoferrodoxin (superoxide reductase-like protein)